MLTINADEHPLMHRFHKPGDEKRSVVVLKDDSWEDWLKAEREEQLRSFLQQFNPSQFKAFADPKPSARVKSAPPGDLFFDQDPASA